MQPGAGGADAGGAAPQPASTTMATAAAAARRRTDGTIDYSPEQFFRCRESSHERAGSPRIGRSRPPDRVAVAARPRSLCEPSIVLPGLAALLVAVALTPGALTPVGAPSAV